MDASGMPSGQPQTTAPYLPNPMQPHLSIAQKDVTFNRVLGRRQIGAGHHMFAWSLVETAMMHLPIRLDRARLKHLQSSATLQDPSGDCSTSTRSQMLLRDCSSLEA